MATDLLEKPRLDDSDTGADDIVHVWCHCDPHRTLCGEDAEMDDENLPYDTEVDCVVCADLNHRRCEKCGCYDK